MSTAWGFGLIVGPALGGYLAQVPFQYKNNRRKILSFSYAPFLFVPSQLKNILTYSLKILYLAGKLSRDKIYSTLTKQLDICDVFGHYDYADHYICIICRFPYLLPCLSVSSLSAIVLISCTWLPVCNIFYLTQSLSCLKLLNLRFIIL